jgi:hypothetical protein
VRVRGGASALSGLEYERYELRPSGIPLHGHGLTLHVREGRAVQRLVGVEPLLQADSLALVHPAKSLNVSPSARTKAIEATRRALHPGHRSSLHCPRQIGARFGCSRPPSIARRARHSVAWPPAGRRVVLDVDMAILELADGLVGRPFARETFQGAAGDLPGALFLAAPAHRSKVVPHGA